MRTSFMNAKDLFRRNGQRHRRTNSRLQIETLEARVVLDGSAIISEFLSANDRTIVDQDGDDSDWIEVMNPTSEPVSLRRWSLTDDATNLTKWRFPEVELQPGEQLIVFASGKDRDNPNDELHANFRLSSTGEYLALVQPDGATVVSEFGPNYPLQVIDVSYGISSGILPSKIVGRGDQVKYLVPTDNSLDPTEPDAISGTWLDPEYDDSAWTEVATGIGFVPPAVAITLADSVAEFSGVQGQDNWLYGTWTRGGDNIYAASEFNEMNAANFFRADTNKWDQGVDAPPYLEIAADSAHPNTTGFFKQWAIRRWVSETAGEVTIAGTINNADPAGDGVIARILKNGEVIFEKSYDGAQENYSITTQVEFGDFIDFAVDAGAADDDTSDNTIFTSTVTGLPFNPAPQVVVADPLTGWVDDAVQGANGWSYGYYDQTNDGDNVFQVSDLTLFPLDFYTGSRWDFPTTDPATDIRETTQTPNGVEDGGPIQWAIRRWTSDWDGPVSLNWNVVKSQTGGDGITGRVIVNGVELDSLTINGDNTDGINRLIELNLNSGDIVDFAIDPVGVGGNVAAPDGDRDRTEFNVQIVRTADFNLDINANVRDDMLGSGSVYTRIPFQIADVGPVRELRLRVKYDAGFAAYINGKPVASENAPDIPAFDSVATAGRDAEDATTFQTIDLSAGIEFLVSGQNVLQIHGLNEAADGDNFLLLPELEVGLQSINADQQRYFLTPTPGEQNGFGVDRLGPIILDINHFPSEPLATDPIIVSAAVTRTFADVTNVSLNYRVMYGDTTTIGMVDDGTAGDATANDGIFSATIPGGIAEKGQMVRWFVTASASDGTQTRAPNFVDPTTDEEYRGTVIQDPELNSNLPVFHWFIETPRRATTAGGSSGSFYYDGEFYDNVFFDLHGQSSQGFPSGSDRVRPFETAKSYDVDFPNNHRFRLNNDIRRMDDFNLLTNYADQSMLRNTLAWEQHGLSGSPSLLAFPVRVQQNGEFFSIYDFVEDGDERWLDRVGLDPNGSLYKMYTTFTAGGNEKKTRTDEGSEDLAEIVAGIRGDNNIEYVFDNVDLPAMVNFVVGMPLVSEVDCCHKNYYAYRDTEGTGEWSFLQWDEDLSQGRVWGGLGRSYFDDTIYSNTRLQVGDNNALLSLLYTQVPGFREMWLKRLRTVFDELYTEPGTPYEDRPFETRVDELYELMKDEAALQNEVNPVDWGQSGFRDFKTSIDLLKQYMTDRREWFYTTQLAPDDSAITRLFTEPEAQTPATYFVPTDDSLGSSWIQPGFDDAAWKSGFSGIGFEQATRGTDYSESFVTSVEEDMAGKNASVYLRVPFNLESVADIQNLTLRMKFDDGFVAYLNGEEVSRFNAPELLAFNSESDGSHRDTLAIEFENYDITEHLGKLKVGENLLAIQGMNSTFDNNDFLLIPELVSGEIIDGAGIVPGPQIGNPKIDFGKIEFQPASNNQAEEYIEIVNNNSSAVDISGWSLSGDANITFKGGTVIPSGWTMYATPDAKSFRTRTEGPSGGQRLFVYGNYSGQLPNAGGTIELRAADGELVSSSTYVGETSQVADFLRVSEVNYNPLNPSAAERAADVSLDAEDFEFVEVVNTSTTETISLDGVRFTKGILFDFTNSAVQTLGPGQRTLIVKDETAFGVRYGAVANIAGIFEPGSGLGNANDDIRLVDSSNSEIASFRISGDSDRGWPERADGAGSSLVAIDVNGDLNDPNNWRASTTIHGTPGSDAVAPITNLVINEVLSNGGANVVDAIEIRNTSAASISLSNYYLSDSASTIDSLSSFKLPVVSIDANGYRIFDESQFNAGDNAFALSGSNGDKVYLTMGDGAPTHFVDNVAFPATAEGESYGRVDGGWFVPLTSPTLGTANSAARVGPLVISEIQYNPGTPSQSALDQFAALVEDDLEFVEIFNPTSNAVDLTNWRIRGGVDIDFEPQTSIGPNEAIVIVSFNPDRADNLDRASAFRTHYGIGPNVRLLGGFGSQLNNGGERVTLEKPGPAPVGQPDFTPRFEEDEVIYSDHGTWPTAADGTGPSLQRISPNSIGIDPSNWVATTPTPGVASSVSPDLDGNGIVDEADVQIVCNGLRSADLSVDFNGSGSVDLNDLIFYINNIVGSSIGDSNLDGVFDSSDLVRIFQVGEYEDATNGNSTWSEGDWNCDGDFTSRDLVVAFINGTFSRQAVADNAGEFDSSVVAAALNVDVGESHHADNAIGQDLDNAQIHDATRPELLDRVAEVDRIFESDHFENDLQPNVNDVLEEIFI